MNNILSIDPALNNLGIVNLNIDVDEKVNINYARLENINGKSMSEKVDNLIKILDSVQNINAVLIENPPCLKNPSLKTIAIAIYTYYKTKGIKCFLVSACLKLNNNKELNYKQKKQESIKKALDLLNEVDKRIINSYSKKDDLSDCINMALEWYKKTYPKKIRPKKIKIIEEEEEKEE